MRHPFYIIFFAKVYNIFQALLLLQVIKNKAVVNALHFRFFSIIIIIQFAAFCF